MPRSACSVALETYHGASTVILTILDLLLWIIDILDLLAQPHNSRPHVQIGMIMAARRKSQTEELLFRRSASYEVNGKEMLDDREDNGEMVFETEHANKRTY
jgi:hypothetical protein